MHTKLPTLAIMQAYYGSFKLLSLRDDRPWIQTRVHFGSLQSGNSVQITWGELGLVFSMCFLLFDLVRAYHERERALTQHFVSFVLFTCSLVQFISIRGYCNVSFLIYLLTVLCELMGGMLIMLASRRALYPRE
jgi:hypothetical protein